MPSGTFKYPGCADVSAAQFTPVTLVNQAKVAGLTEPVRFEVAKDGRIFFGERNGGVRVVQANGTVVKLGQVTVNPLDFKMTGNNELGLSGLALDPEFERTNWIYLTFQPPSPDIMRLSRFKVNGTTLDLASEQVLLSFPMQKEFCCHTGGDLQFDNKGDLWISVGNNTMNPKGDLSSPLAYVDESHPEKDDQGHAANTNDYRGKILRIHPLASPGPGGKLYSIPAGNLKAAFASLWSVDEAAKVLPEIYTMGHRSNYTLSVDTVTGWLTWGDIGPDETRATEEFNITAKPGFFGWPYFAGAKRDGADSYSFKKNKDENAPLNTSPNNTGVQRLPPAIPATIGYTKSAAIAGPIYRWNRSQTSAKKVPPHFDGKWFIADFNVGQVHAVSLDAAGKVVGRTGLIQGLIRPLQIKIGPDGMLYTLEYATNYFTTDGRTAIKRWEYTGPDCAGPTGLAERVDAREVRRGSWVTLGLRGDGFVSLPTGARGLRLFDLQGNRVWEAAPGAWEGPGPRRVRLPASLGKGVFQVRFE